MLKTQTAEPKVDPKWLFMMYMVANDRQLDALAVQDLLEIERAVAKNESIAAVVQIQRRWPASPQRYLVTPGGTAWLPMDENATSQSMGTEKALSRFLQASVDLVKDAESTKFCLVLWGHSYGLGFGRDHGDELRLGELKAALDAFRDQRKAPLDLLGANTCVMSYIEAMYELRDSANYMVASQGFVPFAGWPYDRILPLIDKDTLDANTVGRMIVDKYVEFFDDPGREERVAMTLTNLTSVQPLAPLLKELSTAIGKCVEGTPQVLAVVRDAFLANPAGTTRPVLDLYSLSEDLGECAKELREPPLVPGRKADALTELSCVAEQIARRLRPVAPEGPVLYTRSHPSLENFHGVGIFAPFVVDDGRMQRLVAHNRRRKQRAHQASLGKRSRDSQEEAAAAQSNSGEEEFKALEEGRSKYEGLSIFRDSSADWPVLVFETLAPEQPEETVDANGIVQPVERSAVNQMLFAVDASHRRLARAIAFAKEVVKGELSGWICGQASQPMIARRLLARLGPPELRLIPLAMVLQRAQSEKIPENDTTRPQLVTEALRKLECRLGQVERTVRRVVTDATLGIGPSRSPGGIGASLNAKPMDAGLKEKPIEQGLLEKSMDQGLYDVDKSLDPGLGAPGGVPLGQVSLGSKIVFASSDDQLGGLATVELLGHVTRGLLQLEHDVARIEHDIADFLTNHTRLAAALPGANFEVVVKDRLDELFDLLEQDRVRAHATIRWVLRHPTFGLGPGSAAVGRAERENFAAAAGFNVRQLRLLSSPATRNRPGG